MAQQQRASFSLALATAMLSSCAATPPESPAPDTAAAADNVRFETAMVETGDPVPALSESEKSTECRYERVTGSHMIRKVCLTAAQRRQEEEASKQWMRTRGRSGGVSRVRDAADPRDDDE